MKFEIKVKVGKQEILISDEVKNAIEFFEKVSFFTSLPEYGPNGETDLEFRHRITKDGHNYYSIVSNSGNVELNLGQSKKIPGQLYPKGWQPVYDSFVKEDFSNTIQPVNDTQKSSNPLPKIKKPSRIKKVSGLKKKPIEKTDLSTTNSTQDTGNINVNDIIGKYTA